LLVTQRGRWLQRETICQALWPELDPAAAVNQFNVTLNGLNAALEPDRPPRAQPFFIRRHRLAYAFAPSFGAWIDADEFELRSRVAPPDDPAATRRNRLVALALYQGDYLEEAAWDPWTIDERQRLLSRYLETAISAAAAELEADRPDAAGELAEAALRRDASYEDAWVVLIRSWLARGNRSQALRAWQRCQAALSAELGVEPLPSTRALLELPDR
jgi:DNA-binding SARP family transcriptional activator